MQTMQWCTQNIQTAAPACRMHTLEGFALDHQRGFFLGHETLLNSLIHLGDQFRVFTAATGRVTTKGAFCGMDDGVFHQDDKRLLVLFLHRVYSLRHLLSRCDPPENTV